MSDVYRKLKQRLEDFPIPAVPGKGVLEFLRLAFTEQEAEMLSKFPSFISSLTIEDFARQNGYNVRTARVVFYNLARRNLIRYERKEGKEYFGLQPLVVGIYEAFFSTWKEQNPDTLAPAAKAMEDYFNGGFYKIISNSKSPWARIIPSMGAVYSLITQNSEYYHNIELKITLIDQIRRFGAFVKYGSRFIIQKIFSGRVSETFNILKFDGFPAIKRIISLLGVRTKRVLIFPKNMNIESSLKQKIVKIDKEIPVILKIYPYEVIRYYIEKATAFISSPCACRKANRLLDETYEEFQKGKCKFPVENTCIHLRYGDQIAGKYELRGGHIISKEEALTILNQCEKAGLVHCSYNSRERIEFICNCCPCCCKILGTMIKYHQKYRAFVESNFQPIHQKIECVKCNNCARLCPVHAISPDNEGFPIIDLDICIGCGVCVTNCLRKALKLKKVKNQRPAIDTIEAYLNFANQKIN